MRSAPWGSSLSLRMEALRTTMSVSFAPRARIAVNAAWPGVSRKVIMPRGVCT